MDGDDTKTLSNNGGLLRIDPRQRRGIILALSAKIKRTDRGWVVPSQTKPHAYRVTIDASGSACTCEDFQLERSKCKHIYAVEYILSHGGDATDHIPTRAEKGLPDIEREARKTYRQSWSAYNQAQQAEKEMFQVLLSDLCRSIALLEPKRGRPRHLLRDAAFATTFKVYSLFSGRRFTSDLVQAHARGYVSRPLHYNSVFRYMESEDLTQHLLDLIELSSHPLAGPEDNFAVDQTSFSTKRFFKGTNARMVERLPDAGIWVRLNAICGTRTNIVTNVKVTNQSEAEAPHLPDLVKRTSERFTVRAVSADKAYDSISNTAAIVAVGAEPYIPFRANSTGAEGRRGVDREHTTLYKRAWLYFNLHREEFLQMYHRRSNIESTFAMIKAKFGNSVRSRTETARFNEVLCKVLCHNICVLIQSLFEFGVDLDFKTK